MGGFQNHAFEFQESAQTNIMFNLITIFLTIIPINLDDSLSCTDFLPAIPAVRIFINF